MVNNEEINKNKQPVPEPSTESASAQFGMDKLETILTSRSSNQAIKEYMMKAVSTIKELERKVEEYKALWVDSNTTNIGLGQENRILNEQLKDSASNALRQIEVDKQRQRDDYINKKEEQDLQNALTTDFSASVLQPWQQKKQENSK